ncbi:unnamed protein product [Spirodela intermedia]|uniref:DYW domain-containing protein n=1 Tax=Spirodela intermedia TaxID=51605 RepID=A0A7I8KFI6_SPIIN|nr:unnamed protein product [Spirodela intermedia]
MVISPASPAPAFRLPVAAGDHRHHPVPGAKSTEQWLVSSLKTPQTPTKLKAIHAQVLKTGNAGNDLVLGQLLLCCSLSKSMDYALSVFLSLPSPGPFFYNAMLKGYADNGDHEQCLGIYSLMRGCSVPCDSFTFPAVLRAAGCLARVEVGEEVHGLMVKLGLDGSAILRTAVMDMYFSCGLADRAGVLFEKTVDRDVICWNAMLSGLGKCGELERAHELFDRMPQRNVSSWNTMLDMYCKAGKPDLARGLFDDMPERDIISWNVMISGYGRVGGSGAARKLFESMTNRSVVSWNAVIACYVHNGLFQEALDLFREMQGSDVSPNEVTAVAVLQACAHLGTLFQGQWIEAFIRRRRMKIDPHVVAALIDMYGKCGSVADSQRIFDEARGMRNSVICSSMIDVLATHGGAEKAFEVFESMEREAIQPNEVTFVGLLKACSHAGLVETGRKYFELMEKEFGLTPSLEHYGCMVDLLGRAGLLEEAYELISTMPELPPLVIWSSLLSSCRIHGDVELAENVSLRLTELDPESCGNYVLLSNVYSKAKRWEDAALVRRTMKDKGIKKKPGCSSIEVGGEMHEFLAGGCDHPRSGEIYEMLDLMVVRLRREGYVPNLSTVLQDVGSEERERALLLHSEKLALAFGLLSTQAGGPIRIVKNLRVCEDCHQFVKLASRSYGRQVVMRDCSRFHYFSDGSCSCSDFW